MRREQFEQQDDQFASDEINDLESFARTAVRNAIETSSKSYWQNQLNKPETNSKGGELADLFDLFFPKEEKEDEGQSKSGPTNDTANAPYYVPKIASAVFDDGPIRRRPDGTIFGTVPETTRNETVDKLMTQLASDKYGLRRDAAKQLASIGLPAVPALKEACLSTDINLAKDAKNILDEIRYNALEPKMKQYAEAAETSKELLAKLGISPMKTTDTDSVFFLQDDVPILQTNGRIDPVLKAKFEALITRTDAVVKDPDYPELLKLTRDSKTYDLLEMQRVLASASRVLYASLTVDDGFSGKSGSEGKGRSNMWFHLAAPPPRGDIKVHVIPK